MAGWADALLYISAELALRPFAEYGRTDPNHCRPLFDGHLEVMAHSHREVTEMVLMMGIGRLVSQFAESAEEGTDLLRILTKRGDHHQAFDGQMGERLAGLQQRQKFILEDARLPRLPSQVDLNQNPHPLSEGCPMAVKGGGQLDGVERMDQVEQLDGELAFVRL